MARKYLPDFIHNSVTSDTNLSYAKPLIPEGRIRALKNGQIPWEAKLDLTNYDTKAVQQCLEQLVRTEAKTQERCFLIIHTKNTQKETQPLVKNLLNYWLPQFAEVLAYSSAHLKDGGNDALYVLLKKPVHIDLPTSTGKKTGSYLAEETKSMERKRRLAEQQGERQLGHVKAREHKEEDTKSSGLEGELQNTILQHPELDSQRFDGIDPNLNPEPPLNTDARREFDNEQREQEKEKQLRLGNMPKFTTAPTPRGP